VSFGFVRFVSKRLALPLYLVQSRRGRAEARSKVEAFSTCFYVIRTSGNVTRVCGYACVCVCVSVGPNSPSRCTAGRSFEITSTVNVSLSARRVRGMKREIGRLRRKFEKRDARAVHHTGNL